MDGIGFGQFRFCPLNTLYRGSQFVQREIIGEKQRGVDSQTQQIRKPKHQLGLYISCKDLLLILQEQRRFSDLLNEDFACDSSQSLFILKTTFGKTEDLLCAATCSLRLASKNTMVYEIALCKQQKLASLYFAKANNGRKDGMQTENKRNQNVKLELMPLPLP